MVLLYQQRAWKTTACSGAGTSNNPDLCRWIWKSLVQGRTAIATATASSPVPTTRTTTSSSIRERRLIQHPYKTTTILASTNRLPPTISKTSHRTHSWSRTYLTSIQAPRSVQKTNSIIYWRTWKTLLKWTSRTAPLRQWKISWTRWWSTKCLSLEILKKSGKMQASWKRAYWQSRNWLQEILTRWSEKFKSKLIKSCSETSKMTAAHSGPRSQANEIQAALRKLHRVRVQLKTCKCHAGSNLAMKLSTHCKCSEMFQ